MTSDDRHRPMEAARVRAELSVQELWLRSIALGGSSDPFDVDGYLQGMISLDTLQQDILAEAVNEGLEERYRSSRVPLSTPVDDEVTEDFLVEVVDQLLDRRPPLPDAGTAPREDETP